MFALSLFFSLILPLGSAQNVSDASKSCIAIVPEWQRMAGGSLEFDVASIHPSRKDTEFRSNVPLTDGPSYETTGGTFAAVGPSLMIYIAFAYKVGANESGAGLIQSLPDWVLTDQYDIQAKTDLQEPTKDQIRLMMQSLLADRFALKAHWEIREGDVFALQSAKANEAGPFLRRHVETEHCPAELVREPINDPKALAANSGSLLGVWPQQCHEVQITFSAGRVFGGGRDLTMEQIARWVGDQDNLKLPVQNGTNLSGGWDFIINFTPNFGGDGQDNIASLASGEDFRTALRKQLGLQLKKKKGQSTMFVVDHVQRPSQN